MVIGRKRGARHDLVLPREEASPREAPSPFSSIVLPSRRRFLDPLPASSPFLRSTITRKGHFAAFARPKRAITPTPSASGRRRYFLRIKIFQIYEVVFSPARLREWYFFSDPSGFDVSDMKKNALTEKMSYLRKLFFLSILYISE